MGKGDGRRVEDAKKIDSNWNTAFYSWRCLARKRGGRLCGTVNVDTAAVCTACGSPIERGHAL